MDLTSAQAFNTQPLLQDQLVGSSSPIHIKKSAAKDESGAPLRQEQVEVKSKLGHKRPSEWEEGSRRRAISTEYECVSEDYDTSANAAGTKSSVIVFPRKRTKDGPNEGVVELTVDKLRYFRCALSGGCSCCLCLVFLWGM